MYVSSSAPLPQNSASAPVPDEGMAARRLRDFMFSRLGRQRMYANLPTAESLAYLGLGLAADASQMIAASEGARQAILIGVGNSSSPSPLSTVVEDLQQMIANAPTVISLNGSTAVAPAGGVSSPVTSIQTGLVNSAVMVPTMPQRAPVPLGGVYMNPAQPKGPVQPKQSLTRARLAPPGCGPSGYPPPWADAYVSGPQSQTSSYGGALGWMQRNPLVAMGLALAGLLALTAKPRQ